MQFDQRVVGRPAAQLATTECLFERSELKFHAPTQSIELSGLSRGQIAVRQDVRHEIHLAARSLKGEKPQDQRRLSLPGRLARPEENNAVALTCRAEVFQQMHVGADTN